MFVKKRRTLKFMTGGGEKCGRRTKRMQKIIAKTGSERERRRATSQDEARLTNEEKNNGRTAVDQFGKGFKTGKPMPGPTLTPEGGEPKGLVIGGRFLRKKVSTYPGVEKKENQERGKWCAEAMYLKGGAVGGETRCCSRKSNHGRGDGGGTIKAATLKKAASIEALKKLPTTKPCTGRQDLQTQKTTCHHGKEEEKSKSPPPHQKKKKRKREAAIHPPEEEWRFMVVFVKVQPPTAPFFPIGRPISKKYERRLLFIGIQPQQRKKKKGWYQGGGRHLAPGNWGG